MIRLVVASVLACGLAAHGYKKRSLNRSGALAAVVVGFISFAASYRMGTILIVFYYTGSKMTKVRGETKKRLEYNYKEAGQRDMWQVLTNSVLATIVAATFYFLVGEDGCDVNFRSDAKDDYFQRVNGLSSYLWTLYVAHYACANGDTWASELGVLSRSNPRMITTLCLKEVPRGTNGGVSLEGTVASGLGGALIGLTFYICSIAMDFSLGTRQYPMIVAGLCSGLIGSLVDSLLGALLQATYFDVGSKQIVRVEDFQSLKRVKGSIKRIQGVDILSNEAVNFFAIAITMTLSCSYTPAIFKLFAR